MRVGQFYFLASFSIEAIFWTLHEEVFAQGLYPVLLLHCSRFSPIFRRGPWDLVRWAQWNPGMYHQQMRLPDIVKISFLCDPVIVSYKWWFVIMLLVTLDRWRARLLVILLCCLGLFLPVVPCRFLCNGLWRCHTLSLSCTSSSVKFLSWPLWPLWAVQASLHTPLLGSPESCQSSLPHSFQISQHLSAAVLLYQMLWSFCTSCP